MNIKKRRYINFYWGLIMGLIIFSIIIVTLLESDGIWAINLSITLGVDAGLFICFYVIRTSFKRSKYPFISCDPEDVVNPIFRNISEYKIIWIYLFPIIYAITFPLIFIIMVATAGGATTLEIVLPVIVMIVMLINNVIYAYVNDRVNQKITLSNEFELKLTK